MGFLSNIGKAAKKAVSAVGAAAVHALDFNSIAVSHPITTVKNLVTGGFAATEAQEKKFFSQPLAKQELQIVVGGASIAATVASAGVVAGAAKAGTLAPTAINIAKSVVPATTKGKVIAAVAAPVVVGAVVSQPLKSAEAVAKAPQALANVGANIGNLVANPSIENAKALITENPVIVGGAAAAAAVVGAKTLIPAITTSRQIAATNEQTEAIKNSTSQLLNASQEKSTAKAITAYPVAAQTPVTPETKPLIASAGGTTLSGTRKKRSSVARNASVNQRVNVIVQNRQNHVGIQNKRYIKEVMLH